MNNIKKWLALPFMAGVFTSMPANAGEEGEGSPESGVIDIDTPPMTREMAIASATPKLTVDTKQWDIIDPTGIPPIDDQETATVIMNEELREHRGVSGILFGLRKGWRTFIYERDEGEHAEWYYKLANYFRNSTVQQLISAIRISDSLILELTSKQYPQADRGISRLFEVVSSMIGFSLTQRTPELRGFVECFIDMTLPEGSKPCGTWYDEEDFLREIEIFTRRVKGFFAVSAAPCCCLPTPIAIPADMASREDINRLIEQLSETLSRAGDSSFNGAVRYSTLAATFEMMAATFRMRCNS